MSSMLHKREHDILVIDEAVDLKECESMIRLAIWGIKHIVLIEDDKQLQSVVKSIYCDLLEQFYRVSWIFFDIHEYFHGFLKPKKGHGWGWVL